MIVVVGVVGFYYFDLLVFFVCFLVLYNYKVYYGINVDDVKFFLL